MRFFFNSYPHTEQTYCIGKIRYTSSENEVYIHKKENDSTHIRTIFVQSFAIRIILFIFADKYKLCSKMKFKKQSTDLRLIQDSSLFDEQWYRNNYSEIEKKCISPAEHYLTKGWKKGYNPSVLFSSEKYLSAYPDVKELGINPLVHYLLHGKKEERYAFPIDSCVPTLVEKKDNKPLISIIVASYNYEKYIIETLDSIISQTYKNYEVIVVDDGSKDNSIEVITRYVKRYNNVFLYTHDEHKNKGLPSSLKLGVEKSRGEYIAFCESDDYWHPEHLEKKIEIINSYNNVNIISNGVNMFGDRHTVDFYEKDYMKQLSIFLSNGGNLIDVKYHKFMNYIPTFSSIMIKRDILLSLDYNPVVPAWIDFWLYRQIFKKDILFHTFEKLTYWRMHESYNSLDNSDKYSFFNKLFIQINDSLLSDKESFNERTQIIENSKYFDAEWYKEQYLNNGILKGVNPVIHYLYYGWKNGCEPSSTFSTEDYLLNSSDTSFMDIPPLLHYEISGAKEKNYRTTWNQAKLTNQDIIQLAKSKKETKIILLINNETSLTDTSIALFNIALALKKNGHTPFILSLKNTPLVDKAKCEGIKISTISYIQMQKDEYCTELFSLADIILYNTIEIASLIKILPVAHAVNVLWLCKEELSRAFAEKWCILFDHICSTDEKLENLAKQVIIAKKHLNFGEFMLQIHTIQNPEDIYGENKEYAYIKNTVLKNKNIKFRHSYFIVKTFYNKYKNIKYLRLFYKLVWYKLIKN